MPDSSEACSRDFGALKEIIIMSFGLYLGGLLLVLGGLVYAAAMLHAPTHWIVIGAVVLLGFGIVSAVRATRQRDPAG